jgi:hypothetical protein
VGLCSLQTFPSPVPALSDFITSMSDYLAPSLEHNNYPHSYHFSVFSQLTTHSVTARPEIALVVSLVRRVAGGDAPEEEES